MGRILGHALPRAASLLRPDSRLLRRMPLILMLIAAGLSAWVLELGAILQGQAQVRNWSSVWVGLDLMEIVGLVVTAVLLRRRSAYLNAVAAVTAALFAVDAWFDVLTAAAGAAWYESLADALFGEIPMTVLLTAIAVWATHQHLGQHRCGSRANARGQHAPFMDRLVDEDYIVPAAQSAMVRRLCTSSKPQRRARSNPALGRSLGVSRVATHRHDEPWALWCEARRAGSN